MDVIPTIRTASRAFYQAYLNSSEWKRQRNRALQRAFYTCQKCGAKRHLEVHHTSYDRLGAEFDSDLEVLCRDCHEGHHLDEMADSSYRVYLKLASTVQARRVFATVADLADEVKRECVRLKIPYDAYRVNRALEFMTAADRMTPPIPETPAQVMAEGFRPLTHAESRETLRRLGLDSLLKTMPSSPQKIDIYGPVPDDDNWGDHDRY